MAEKNITNKDKQDLAKLLYMQGVSQVEISEKTNVSQKTISLWVNKFGWDAQRAGRNITRTELVNKTLVAIDNILNKHNNDNNPNKTLDADKLSKLAKIIRDIDKKTNVVDAIEVFIAFNKWLDFRMQQEQDLPKEERKLTPEFKKLINTYQDLFITEKWLSNL
jgi:transposase